MTTVTVDDRKRVRLPGAKPGQVFAYETLGPNKVLLTKVEPVQDKPSRARLVKEGDYWVGELDHPIDMEALQRAIEDWP